MLSYNTNTLCIVRFLQKSAKLQQRKVLQGWYVEMGTTTDPRQENTGHDKP